jgi:hypothetical protein
MGFMHDSSLNRILATYPYIIHKYLNADGIVIEKGTAIRENISEVLEKLGAVSAGQTYALPSESATFATKLLMNLVYIDLPKRILTDTPIRMRGHCPFINLKFLGPRFCRCMPRLRLGSCADRTSVLAFRIPPKEDRFY